MPRQDESVVNMRIKANREIGQHTCTVSGREFVVFPTVFSPEFNSSTQWASKIFPFPQPNESMLEIGTGCGVLSILAALAGCRDVTATDINPFSFYDPGYQLMDRYMATAGNYLKPGGRLYITFSPDTGNLERFNELTEKHGWTPLLVNSTECQSMSDSVVSFNLYQLVPTESMALFHPISSDSETSSGSGAAEYGSSYGSTASGRSFY